MSATADTNQSIPFIMGCVNAQAIKNMPVNSRATLSILPKFFPNMMIDR
jgi:hypothetical protein